MNKINTKADPFAAFKAAVDKAISAAQDAHVGSREIAGYLRSRTQWLEARAYQSPSTVNPRTYDQNGKLIDYNAKIEEARAARQRRADAASEIPAHLRQSAASGYSK